MAELTRYQEFKRLALLAGPLMTAQLAQMGMGVTDAVMAGHYGAVDLAGVALAGSLMWPVMMLFMGCLQALTHPPSPSSMASKTIQRLARPSGKGSGLP